MLEAVNLECVRGQRRLFHGLSFQLVAGETLRVLGLNGSGKTSLLRLLCGLLRPEAGSVRWNGADVRKNPDEFHRDLLFVGHAPAIKDDLSGRENLEFGLVAAGDAPTRDEADAALADFGLAGREHVPARALSQGQRRRVALARLALSATKRLWILDEPFTALDTQAAELVRSRIARHAASGGSVVFTTHQEIEFGDLPVRRLQLVQ